MRTVLDTNVLVSLAIKPRSQLAAHLRQGDFLLLASNATLDELVDVLNRPRLRQKYRLTPQYIHIYLHLLRLRMEWVNPAEPITICRDPQDNKFLEVAVTGHADVIVSADNDLLVLHPFSGIPIIPPAEFLKLLEK
jgi:hypothetical protein